MTQPLKLDKQCLEFSEGLLLFSKSGECVAGMYNDTLYMLDKKHKAADTRLINALHSEARAGMPLVRLAWPQFRFTLGAVLTRAGLSLTYAGDHE